MALATVAAPAGAQPGPEFDRAAAASRTDAIFEAFDSRTSPGCAVGVYHGDRPLHRAAYGMANLDHDVPLKPDSVFHVASVSKQFTAAAILLLAQDGKLSIDDDVRKYIPELPDFGHTVTIRHLAHHTSGIRDQWTLLGLAGWRYSRDLITDDDVLEMLVRQKDLNFRPGERHLYSNSGYTLMAIVVSRVSGTTFREFTTERIFKPLGMHSTRFRDNFSEVVKRQAYGYASERGAHRLSVTNFDTAGATSLLTTVEDLARWHANFDAPAVGGERLIGGLLERGVLNDGSRIDYAFGLAHGTYRGLRTVEHGGSDAGYRSAFLRFPDRRLGIAVLCNAAGARPGELARRAADVYLAGLLQRAETTEPEDAPDVPLPEARLARYAGLYWNERELSYRRIVLQNGRLHLAMGREPLPMKSIGDGRFLLTTPGSRMRLAFEEDDGNGAVRLRIGDGPTGIFERAEAAAPTEAQLEALAGVYRSDEMDAVFRFTVKNGRLTLERSKSRPAAIDPVIADAFSSPPGLIRFTRDAAGHVTGFTLYAGRVLGMKFWKDTRPGRPGT